MPKVIPGATGVLALADGTVLAAMYASSTMLDPDLRPRARRAIGAGTALFLASDTILGMSSFVLKDPSPRLETAVMATYTAGQALIAAGVAGSAP